MVTLNLPITSAVGDTIRSIERLAWAITARLAVLAIVGLATAAMAGFINYGPLADQLSSWSPLNAMGAVIGTAVLLIALLGAAKSPRGERTEAYDVE